VRIEGSQDDYRLRALFRHGRERTLEVVDAADDGRDESNARLRCRRLQILHERTAVRIGRWVAERTATQLRSGISCLRSWRRLPPISASMPDKPVTFPPG